LVEHGFFVKNVSLDDILIICLNVDDLLLTAQFVLEVTQLFSFFFPKLQYPSSSWRHHWSSLMSPRPSSFTQDFFPIYLSKDMKNAPLESHQISPLCQHH